MIKAVIAQPDQSVLPTLSPPQTTPSLTVHSTLLDGGVPKQIESYVTTQQSLFQNPFNQRLSTLEGELRNILSRQMSDDQKLILYKSTLNQLFATDKMRHIPHKKRNIGLNLAQLRASTLDPGAPQARGRAKRKRTASPRRARSLSQSPPPVSRRLQTSVPTLLPARAKLRGPIVMETPQKLDLAPYPGDVQNASRRLNFETPTRFSSLQEDDGEDEGPWKKVEKNKPKRNVVKERYSTPPGYAPLPPRRSQRVAYLRKV